VQAQHDRVLEPPGLAWYGAVEGPRQKALPLRERRVWMEDLNGLRERGGGRIHLWCCSGIHYECRDQETYDNMYRFLRRDETGLKVTVDNVNVSAGSNAHRCVAMNVSDRPYTGKYPRGGECDGWACPGNCTPDTNCQGPN